MAKRVPGICYHSTQQRYYVCLSGHQEYLSKQMPEVDPPPAEVQRKYHRILAEWLVAQSSAPGIQEMSAAPTIDEIWLGYWKFCQTYYRKNGKVTSEAQCIRDACRVVARLYGETRARDFGPKCLRAIQGEFFRMGWERGHINKNINRVRRMFRWAVSEELVEESVWRALKSVEDLRKNDPRYPGLREERKILPVADDIVLATIPYLPRGLQTLVKVHRLVGCRADEICAMRPCELDRSDPEVWKFTPSSSKNDAVYWIGPKAQALLSPILDAAKETDWLFPTKKRGPGHWSTASYRRAVLRGLTKGNLPRWSPLMIRHAAAQEARDGHEKGIEATQARLSHAHADVSQIYANQLEKLAKEVAKRFG